MVTTHDNTIMGWIAIWQAIGSKKPLPHEGKKAYHVVALDLKWKKGDERMWMVSTMMMRMRCGNTVSATLVPSSAPHSRISPVQMPHVWGHEPDHQVWGECSYSSSSTVLWHSQVAAATCYVPFRLLWVRSWVLILCVCLVSHVCDRFRLPCTAKEPNFQDLPLLSVPLLSWIWGPTASLVLIHRIILASCTLMARGCLV